MDCDVFLDSGGQLRHAAEAAALQSIRRDAVEDTSAMLSQDAEVGVKRTWKRGCFSDHLLTFGCLCVA